MKRAAVTLVVAAAIAFVAPGPAARGESPAAFGRRCIPPGCVAPRSNIPDILTRRALPAGRIAALGATPDFHHGLLAQESFSTGQNIAPVYEGWEQNGDGSFNLVFGYFNRNWEEEINLPIGADNQLEPGGPDQGQPTHFFPRRNRFVFRIKVAKDFAKREIVWTLTSNGKTERAYGSLKPDYFIDDTVIMSNFGAAGMGGTDASLIGNKPPVLKVEGGKSRTIKAGKSVSLVAVATDDGIPKARPMPRLNPGFASRFTVDSATGLRLSWFVYRGAGKVALDPVQTKVWEDTRDGGGSPWAYGWRTPPVPADGKWIVRASFPEPGTYVLRCLAHDGGLATAEDVTFVVTP